MILSNKRNKNDFLKNKKLLLATWGCGDKNTFQCRDWIPLFQKMFGKLVVFTLRDYYYHYGKEALNKEFLRILEREKPDYLLFGPSFYGQISMETLAQIKKLSPKSKTIIEFGDDDWRFEDWSRYYALFFDYKITTKKETSIYKKDKIRGVTVIHGINEKFYRPMNLKKEYDVTFIGRPIADRYDYIKFLKEKGINIRLFGIGWQSYSDLKDIYDGILYGDDYPKIVNQSKINLNFSKTLYDKGKIGQLKGRMQEVPACGAFLLTEYTPMGVDFINKKREINFKGKEELLEKINYYLKHEEEREKITKKMHEYIIKNYSYELLFTRLFRKIEKDQVKDFNLPKFNKKIFSISEKEINSSINELKEKIKIYDYVGFSKDNSESLPIREYLQSYSLYISKKQISCCDYYIYSKGLGDYMLSMMKESFYNLKKEDFLKVVNISQLMVTKEYFLENIDIFKKLFFGEQINIINEKNTVFVSIPLLKVQKIPLISYERIKKSFHMLFIDNLSNLFFQKKIFSTYFINLFFESIFGKLFILKYLIGYLTDIKSNVNILKSFSGK